MSDPEPGQRSPRGPIKLSYWDKWLVYSASIGVWLSGALWLVYIYFMRFEGEFGLERDPFEAVWQKVHGIIGYVAAFGLGTMWGVHVVRGWQAHWRRWSGGTLFGVGLFLSLSGVALYYVTGTAWHEWTAIAHWAVGLAALAAFLIHWLTKSRPKLG